MILHTSHLYVRKNITMKYCICRTNVVMNYTETEAKVREATNDDAWGPTGTICASGNIVSCYFLHGTPVN